MKFTEEFRTEWLKRYREAIANKTVLRGGLRDSGGCMCAIGFAYDMLVEAGEGKWVNGADLPESLMPVPSNVEVFISKDGVKACGTATVAMHLLGASPKSFSDWTNIARNNDVGWYDEAARRIAELPVVEA